MAIGDKLHCWLPAYAVGASKPSRLPLQEINKAFAIMITIVGQQRFGFLGIRY